MRERSLMLLTVVFLLSSTAHADVTAGLVGWWKLDDGSGTSAADSIGSNSGTLTNGLTWTSGKRLGGLSLDGSNDYVQITSSAIAANLTNSSVTAWVKPSALAGEQIIYGEDSGSGIIWRLELSGTGAEFSIYNGSWHAASGATVLQTGIWYHLAGTLNSTGGMTVYVNGVQDGTDANTSPSSGGIVSVELGRYTNGGGNGYLNGTIDDVRIYSRTLTAQEVNAIYLAGTPQFKAGGGARLTGMKMN